MMLSINFYDKFCRLDGEVCNIGAYRCLAANVNSIEFFELSQLAPKPLFAFGYGVAKLPGSRQSFG